MKRKIFEYGIDEWAEATIYKNQEEIHIDNIRDNSYTDTAKNELTQLVAGDDNKVIDIIWAKIDGVMTSKNVTTSRSESTLEVSTDTPFTTEGNYSAIFSGNSTLGDGSYYNSISINIDLSSGSELDFTVKWAFSGGDESGQYCCASRLGAVGDDYDNPIGTLDGTGITPVALNNSVSNNTLTAINDSAVTGPTDVESVQFKLDNSGNNFAQFTQFTIGVASGQEFYAEGEFVFG